MKLISAVNTGRDCGLQNIGECVLNIDFHSMNLFPYDKISEEMEELYHDIDILAQRFGLEEQDVYDWSLKEYELYRREK